MLEGAAIIRRHGAAVRARLGTRLLPSQARALRDLVACRTDQTARWLERHQARLVPCRH